ncbi:hypothetical protein SAMN00017405_0665 [Desulfonispora thiosulfatigenes DSM 11270]|uniref:UPF0178 protein SAMN00017405_0665 n=1 Tax=Desulfonispora thiosulfatigenes DSM 11270 TaxID=656914 RepID=A0A1W1V8R3_DESTI|nr:YaiI/YqxD family protein [Desulfonispora thiosulfatigenes]SMB89819.1 hypothetical protein SAMN00017405_0665 [Desulfonispora thiosulfatigenes DSM 11270]
MNIYVDADACPVKDIIIDLGQKYKVKVVIVCSISHYSKALENVESIIVDNVPQAADMAIINKIKENDIVITQDYGLASIALAKKCKVLHHTGKPYTNENIDNLLLNRHISSKIRRAGGKTKGPKAFTEVDRERFRMALSGLLDKK